ncbi:hypothetical protein [Devosia ginsengisoli]|uniref:hypothetical protein n=1 Tax=Devosia ginsengisoli TaxID=400770 RepID=UPI0026ED89C7|nr:hypothetical protein [Devosia ginsengisoli]MCR6672988.1 hypothetical protein [Devosia ginsengisoli]
MTNLAHIAETASLILAAYLLGCAIGYGARRILHAGRGTRQVAAVAVAPAVPSRPRSTAARLAASVEDLPADVAPVVAATTIVAPEKPARQPRRKVKSPDRKPVTLSAPRSGGADNLKQIKGIGPKIEASLHAMGIFHIDQIAGWSKADMEWVEAQLAFKGRVRRERWVEQAVELGKVSVGA